MIERRRAEIDLVEKKYGRLELPDDLSWLIIPRLPLPEGWDLAETPLLLLIPAGYPTTPPDNFYVSNDLRLAGGADPASAPREQSQLGKMWRMFSWHIDETWNPSGEVAQIATGDNLLTFLLRCEDRLRELD